MPEVHIGRRWIAEASMIAIEICLELSFNGRKNGVNLYTPLTGL